MVYLQRSQWYENKILEKRYIEVKEDDFFPYQNFIQENFAEFLGEEIRRKNHLISNLIWVFSKIFFQFFGKGIKTKSYPRKKKKKTYKKVRKLSAINIKREYDAKKNQKEIIKDITEKSTDRNNLVILHENLSIIKRNINQKYFEGEQKQDGED